MKKYFEYTFNDSIRADLLEYYEKYDGKAKKMHCKNHTLKIKQKIERMQKHLKFEPRETICDIGCSQGALLLELAGLYKYGVGLDISESLIKMNNEKCSFDMKNTINFEVFDGANVGYNDKFDKVILLDVLEHAFDPDALIKSIWVSLKSNGILIIQVPTTGWLSELFFGKYHAGHLRYYDDNYLVNYLEQFGFKIDAINVYNSVPYSSQFLKYQKLFRLMDNFCNAIPPKFFPYYGSVMAIACKQPIPSKKIK